MEQKKVAKKGGRARWAGYSKEERREAMREVNRKGWLTRKRKMKQHHGHR